MSTITEKNTPPLWQQSFNIFCITATATTFSLTLIGLPLALTNHDLGLSFGLPCGIGMTSMVIGPIIPFIVHKVRNYLDERAQKSVPLDQNYHSL